MDVLGFPPIDMPFTLFPFSFPLDSKYFFFFYLFLFVVTS